MKIDFPSREDNANITGPQLKFINSLPIDSSQIIYIYKGINIHFIITLSPMILLHAKEQNQRECKCLERMNIQKFLLGYLQVKMH